MLFNRKEYIDKLISANGNGMIKIITGIRRCGKSFLLFTLFKQHLINNGVASDHIIEVNLEDRRNRELRDPDALLKHIDGLMTDKEKYYILLDEVQMVDEFEDVLNSYLHISNAEVYVTGSNAKFLSKDIITEFRGRGWEIHIQPLSFSEYYQNIGGDFTQALETYYIYGGLPGVALLESEEEKQQYLRNVYDIGQVDVYRNDDRGKSVRSNLEIDFVINKADERLYIQSAYSLPDHEKLLQEEASLINVPDCFRKIIIVGDQRHSKYNDKGVYLLSLYDFLTKGRKALIA